MAILEILTYPDKFLSQVTKPVENVNDKEIQNLIDDMAETMYKAPGIGLAAPQIGSDQSVIVYDPEASKGSKNFKVLINPVIVDHKGEQISKNEACLSVPDFQANVRRSFFVTVKALDRHGNPLSIEAEGLHAVILQHEIDHLNGTLYIDRISSLKRGMYKRKIKKLLRVKN